MFKFTRNKAQQNTNNKSFFFRKFSTTCLDEKKVQLQQQNYKINRRVVHKKQNTILSKREEIKSKAIQVNIERQEIEREND